MKRVLILQETRWIFDTRLKGIPFILRVDRWISDATDNIEIVVPRLLPKKSENANALFQYRIGGNKVEVLGSE